MVVSNMFGAVVFVSAIVLGFIALFIIQRSDEQGHEPDFAIKFYLEDNGYTSIEDWARDSEYVWRDGDGGEGWYDRLYLGDEWRGPYDIREQLLAAIDE